MKMPAYHSSFTNTNDRLGNMALLPIKTTTRGPAACLPVSQACLFEISTPSYFFILEFIVLGC